MGVYIKHWSLADWKELLKWAKIGANNAMIGEFTEVEEVPPHGDLIDQNALKLSILNLCFHDEVSILKNILDAVNNAPVVIKSDNKEDE